MLFIARKIVGAEAASGVVGERIEMLETEVRELKKDLMVFFDERLEKLAEVMIKKIENKDLKVRHRSGSILGNFKKDRETESVAKKQSKTTNVIEE